jgi:hypothetical protein
VMMGAGFVALWMGMTALWGVDHLSRRSQAMLGGIQAAPSWYDTCPKKISLSSRSWSVSPLALGWRL